MLRMEAQHETVAGTLDEAARYVPAWVSAPSAQTADPLAAAISVHGEALREHLADEEEHVLPLIAEYLTVAEWGQLGERFARDTPKDKLLFFLGLILEDASPQERELMLGTCPRRPGCCGTRSGSARSSGRSAGSAPISADPAGRLAGHPGRGVAVRPGSRGWPGSGGRSARRA